MAIASFPRPVLAATAGINFGGTIGINNFCQVVLVEGGILAQSNDQQELSSKQVGGRAGRAQITTTSGRYSVSIDTPSGFSSMPVGGDTNVSFASTYSLSGATALAETSGNTATKLKRGLTDIVTQFIATRSIDPFPAGTYGSVLTVRCE